MRNTRFLAGPHCISDISQLYPPPRGLVFCAYFCKDALKSAGIPRNAKYPVYMRFAAKLTNPRVKGGFLVFSGMRKHSILKRIGQKSEPGIRKNEFFENLNRHLTNTGNMSGF